MPQYSQLLAWAQTRDSAYSTELTWFSWSDIALENCDFSGWKDIYPISTWGWGSCLWRNIRQCNPQSHVTGPKIVHAFIYGVINVGFKKCWIQLTCGKVAATFFWDSASWSSAVGRQKQDIQGSRCLLTVTMWYKTKNVHLSLFMMHGGPESQSQHNITTSMWLTPGACITKWVQHVLDLFRLSGFTRLNKSNPAERSHKAGC